MSAAIAKRRREVDSVVECQFLAPAFTLCPNSTFGSFITSTREIAEDVVALSKALDLDGIGMKYWSDDIVSIEDMEGPMARLKGRETVGGKGIWWNSAHEVHGIETFGSFVNGNQFMVRWVMDVTQKESGNRITMDEVALYTVKDGRIVEERFFY